MGMWSGTGSSGADAIVKRAQSSGRSVAEQIREDDATRNNGGVPGTDIGQGGGGGGGGKKEDRPSRDREVTQEARVPVRRPDEDRGRGQYNNRPDMDGRDQVQQIVTADVPSSMRDMISPPVAAAPMAAAAANAFTTRQRERGQRELPFGYGQQGPEDYIPGYRDEPNQQFVQNASNPTLPTYTVPTYATQFNNSGPGSGQYNPMVAAQLMQQASQQQALQQAAQQQQMFDYYNQQQTVPFQAGPFQPQQPYNQGLQAGILSALAGAAPGFFAQQPMTPGGVLAGGANAALGVANPVANPFGINPVSAGFSSAMQGALAPVTTPVIQDIQQGIQQAAPMDSLNQPVSFMPQFNVAQSDPAQPMNQIAPAVDSASPESDIISEVPMGSINPSGISGFAQDILEAGQNVANQGNIAAEQLQNAGGGVGQSAPEDAGFPGGGGGGGGRGGGGGGGVPAVGPIPVAPEVAAQNIFDIMSSIGAGTGVTDDIWEIPPALQEYLSNKQLSPKLLELLRLMGFTSLGDLGQFGFEADFRIPADFLFTPELEAYVAGLTPGELAELNYIMNGVFGKGVPTAATTLTQGEDGEAVVTPLPTPDTPAGTDTAAAPTPASILQGEFADILAV